MFDKVRGAGKSKEFKWKNWVAYILFFAIILVFALWGVAPTQNSGSIGGVAAVVNNSTISLAEYRTRLENVEQNVRQRMNQFPEPLRRAEMQKLRKRVLDELVFGELFYQEATRRGITATDAEVRNYLLEIPFLQENGRFQKDRYAMFLRNMNLTGPDFERQIRKQIVTQKLQEMFMGIAMPSQEEVKRNNSLASQKINLKFVEIQPEDLQKSSLVSDQKVAEFAQSKSAEIEKYYKDNQTEFTHQESVKARHILLSNMQQKSDAGALSKAREIRAQLTPQNFSELAKKHSDDPGSKVKGGDLGEFSRGRMVPEFEKAAFTLEPGTISEPVKSDFGYHLILVEKKQPARTDSLADVRDQIARKLYMRENEAIIKEELKKLVAAGDRKQLEAWISRAGLKWAETGEFSLANPEIPKIGGNPQLMQAVFQKGRNPGMIPQVMEDSGRSLVVELASWKEDSSLPLNEGMDRMMAFRRSSELIETWSKEVESQAKIQLNPRLLQ